MSLDKIVDNRNDKTARDKQDLEELFSKIIEELKCEENSLGMHDRELRNTFTLLLEAMDILDFKVLLKFTKKQKNAVVEEKMIQIFITFLQRLEKNKQQDNSILVQEYQNYKKAIGYLKHALPIWDDEEFQWESLMAPSPTYNCDSKYEINVAFREFVDKANEYLKEHKKAYDEFKISSNIQSIKDDFKAEMLNLCEYYRVNAKDEIEKASLSNAIAKYFQSK